MTVQHVQPDLAACWLNWICPSCTASRLTVRSAVPAPSLNPGMLMTPGGFRVIASYDGVLSCLGVIPCLSCTLHLICRLWLPPLDIRYITTALTSLHSMHSLTW